MCLVPVLLFSWQDTLGPMVCLVEYSWPPLEKSRGQSLDSHSRNSCFILYKLRKQPTKGKKPKAKCMSQHYTLEHHRFLYKTLLIYFFFSMILVWKLIKDSPQNSVWHQSSHPPQQRSRLPLKQMISICRCKVSYCMFLCLFNVDFWQKSETVYKLKRILKNL